MKKDKHRNYCRKQQRYLPLSILLVDGILGKEAQFLLTTLSRLLATEMEEHILHVHGWVNSPIATMVMRLYSRMLCRACVPSPLQTQDPDWELGSGLGLAQ